MLYNIDEPVVLNSCIISWLQIMFSEHWHLPSTTTLPSPSNFNYHFLGCVKSDDLKLKLGWAQYRLLRDSVGHQEKRLRQRELEFFSKFSWTQDTQSFSFENSIKIKVRDKLSTFWGWNDFSLVHWRWFLFHVQFVIKVERLNKSRLFLL